MGVAVNKYLLRDEPHASAAKIEKFINELHADDLCLVMACERSDESAWADLMESFGSTVRSAARNVSQNAEAAEELTQSIWAELYGLRAREGVEGAAHGKLAHYSGRGSLGGWLRAVVGQLAIDQHRRNPRLVQMECEADGDRLGHEQHDSALPQTSVAARDPEMTLMQAESAEALHAALSRAIEALSADDRLLIKLYYFDDLRLREIGALLGVHEATASRRVSHLQRELKKEVQKILISEHGWSATDAERSLIETAAHLDVELSHLVGAQPAETNASMEKRLIKSEKSAKR
ncbi:MAG: sigma-70 family RNA polymerase sigma factor [Pyrinomonadaceae bacterium]